MSSLAGAIVPGEVLSWNGYPQVTLTCQRDDSLDTPAAAVVSEAVLVADAARGATGGGRCELPPTGFLATQPPNLDVTFVYVHDQGQQSALKTVTPQADGNQGLNPNTP